MVDALLLAFAVSSTQNGSGCIGNPATIGAFIGPQNPPAHVRRIDKVVPSDPSFEGYAIAYVNQGSDGTLYLTFPIFRRLAPDMVGLLSVLIGRRFVAADAASVIPVTPAIKAQLEGSNFRYEWCAGSH
jgi:hypothetical protein